MKVSDGTKEVYRMIVERSLRNLRAGGIEPYAILAGPKAASDIDAPCEVLGVKITLLPELQDNEMRVFCRGKTEDVTISYGATTPRPIHLLS
jgi:hypothetical protein